MTSFGFGEVPSLLLELFFGEKNENNFGCLDIFQLKFSSYKQCFPTPDEVLFDLPPTYGKVKV